MSSRYYDVRAMANEADMSFWAELEENGPSPFTSTMRHNSDFK